MYTHTQTHILTKIHARPFRYEKLNFFNLHWRIAIVIFHLPSWLDSNFCWSDFLLASFSTTLRFILAQQKSKCQRFYVIHLSAPVFLLSSFLNTPSTNRSVNPIHGVYLILPEALLIATKDKNVSRNEGRTFKWWKLKLTLLLPHIPIFGSFLCPIFSKNYCFTKHYFNNILYIPMCILYWVESWIIAVVFLSKL